MNNLILDFEQAKSKHLLFKSRLRSILYDIDVDEAPVLSHYECSVGQWIYNHALESYGHIPEMIELEKVHADIHTSARKLVAMHRDGKTAEARTGLAEMEAIADKLISLLNIIEQKITAEPDKQQASKNLDFRFEEYHELLRSNAELDKRIQQQIAESNESNLRYETVLSALHEGIIIQDANGIVQSSNHSAQLLLGLTEGQLFGRSPMDQHWKAIDENGADIPAEEQAPMLALQTGYPELNQLMGIIRRDGSTVWLRVNAQPLINRDNGDITGVVSSFFDVTNARVASQELQKSYAEQQALNEELAASNEEHITINDELQEVQDNLNALNIHLKESESRFRSLVEQSPVAIALFRSRELIIEIVNNNMLEIWGKPRSIENTPLATAMPELVSQPFIPVLQNVLLTGESFYGYESKAFIIRHGTRVQGYFNFICQPIKDESGAITSVLQVVIDVTEQVLVRLELRRAEEMTSMAIEAAQLGSWHITPETKALQYNTTLAKIFGYEGDEPMTYEQAIGQVTEEYRDRIINEIEIAIASGGNYDITYSQRRFNDGEVIWLRSTGKVSADDKGEYTVFSGVVMDITEQKLDELRKNDFIAMVSHELKTPLTSLMAITQLAGIKLKNNEDKFLNGAMEKATAQVKKMTGMINGFLNISRLESGKLMISKQPFDLAALLDETIEESLLTVSSHQINFEPHTPLTIIADRDKIGSVISNLISNAIKYSPRESTITIKCEQKSNEVLVSVQDEGLGIKPDDTEKLFDRYYRVEDNNTHHISGFGIGLYLSAEIINHHNGHIWVNSEIDKGSTFYFSLPLG